MIKACDVCNRLTPHFLDNCSSHSIYPRKVTPRFKVEDHISRMGAPLKEEHWKAPVKLERVSTAGTKKVIRLTTVSHQYPLCVSCGEEVEMLHYTGSILGGLMFRTIEKNERLPLVVEHHYPDPFMVVSGGELVQTERKIGFRKRIKGALCNRCAGLTTILEYTNKKGEVTKHPLIQTDPTGRWNDSILPPAERYDSVEKNVQFEEHKHSAPLTGRRGFIRSLTQS